MICLVVLIRRKELQFTLVGHPMKTSIGLRFVILLELCPPTNLNVSKGQNENTLLNAPGNCEDFVVSSLPYFSIGNNATSGDDWNVAAGEYQGNDVAYKLMLCDTQLYF